MDITDEDVKGLLSFINKPDTNKLQVSVMGDSDVVRKTYLLTRGNYDQHAEEVTASTPGGYFALFSQLSKEPPRFG
jgi:hypothetical protein